MISNYEFTYLKVSVISPVARDSRMINQMSFIGKVVTITGSSSGIGAAAAIAFTREGANVTIVGRNEVKLKKVAEECARAGKQPLVIKGDVSNDDDAKKMIQNTIDKYGKLDVLINNAAIAKHGVLIDGSAMKSYDEIMNINMRAVVYLTTLATPHLAKTKGNVINVSSVSGIATPASLFLVYGTAKAALNHFTKGAALELSSLGIRVNAISLGPVKTDIIENAAIPTSWEEYGEMTALGRVSEPEEIADLMMFLASDKAKGITGSNFLSDNGYIIKK